MRRLQAAFKPDTNNSKLPAARIAGVLLPAALVPLHVWDDSMHWSPVLVWAGIHFNHENSIHENSFSSEQLVQLWVQ